MQKVMSTVRPINNLTYQEWMNVLKNEYDIIVSSRYHSKCIEKRVLMDEFIEINNGWSSDFNKPNGYSILFGKLKSFLKKI